MSKIETDEMRAKQDRHELLHRNRDKLRRLGLWRRSYDSKTYQPNGERECLRRKIQMRRALLKSVVMAEEGAWRWSKRTIKRHMNTIIRLNPAYREA
jgi:hypothetical protein